jgi:hypothetical protein
MFLLMSKINLCRNSFIPQTCCYRTEQGVDAAQIRAPPLPYPLPDPSETQTWRLRILFSALLSNMRLAPRANKNQVSRRLWINALPGPRQISPFPNILVHHGSSVRVSVLSSALSPFPFLLRANFPRSCPPLTQHSMTAPPSPWPRGSALSILSH